MGLGYYVFTQFREGQQTAWPFCCRHLEQSPPYEWLPSPTCYIQHIDMDLSERQSRGLIGLLYRWRHLGRVDGHVDTNSMCSYAIRDQGRPRAGSGPAAACCSDKTTLNSGHT